MQEILLNIESKEIRYAYLKNGLLQDLIIERKKSRQLTGNVYRGEVTNVLHNIQSAFIDIGEGENGFIHISDILENTQKFQEMFDMDFDLDQALSEKHSKRREMDISKLLKFDQPVLVQVVKEPIGSKGARLTSNVSITGRYLVLLPNTPHRGVSRKIEDPSSRKRLKKLIRAFEMPKDMGLICRTASMNATTEMLVEEATDLLKTWTAIAENFHKATKPTCLYQESDLIKRAVMTAVDKKFDRLLIDDYDTYLITKRIYGKYSEEHALKIEYYKDKVPLFDKYNVEREIEKALRRKIWLPSGGYLFFERTEAMHTIDVNSGRGTQGGAQSVDEALVHINMEAADEIARQLRLRNIGGLVICDFIDMRLRKNQKRVLDRLKEAMKDDSAKCTILGMSEFGLVEMTRQRSRESLAQTLFTGCPYCLGSGIIKTHESVAIEIERDLNRILCSDTEHFDLELFCHPDLKNYLHQGDKDYFRKVAAKKSKDLKILGKDSFHLNDFQFYSPAEGKKIDV